MHVLWLSDTMEVLVSVHFDSGSMSPAMRSYKYLMDIPMGTAVIHYQSQPYEQ